MSVLDSDMAHAELAPFITVPAVTLPDWSIEPSFKVGRYLCSKGSEGKAVVDATLAPWVRLNHEETLAACAAAGFKLITERQALAIAINIACVGANWTSGVVGEGSLFQGLHKWSVMSAQPGNFVPGDTDEQRWFTLSNGERICDAAGNAFTRVFDNVQGDAQGLVAQPFATNSISITAAVAPSRKKGAGGRPRAGVDWSGHSLVRGGFFRSEDRAGVFGLGIDWPGYAPGGVGFRCVK